MPYTDAELPGARTALPALPFSVHLYDGEGTNRADLPGTFASAELRIDGAINAEGRPGDWTDGQVAYQLADSSPRIGGQTREHTLRSQGIDRLRIADW